MAKIYINKKQKLCENSDIFNVNTPYSLLQSKENPVVSPSFQEGEGGVV